MPPNIVWVTLESVRADHSSVHGYGRATTPELERIAGESTGVAFPTCVSASMWTPASTASMLTGTHLYTHRVGYDGQAEEPLRPSLTTLPSLLSDAGYHTACLSSTAYLSEATGLDRGFDRFTWLSMGNLHRKRETLLPLVRYLLAIRSHGPGLTLNVRRHNKTHVMGSLLRRWVRSFAAREDPFFLYVHCPNPHLPYTPPRRWAGTFADDIAMSVDEAIDLSLETYHPRESMVRTIANGCRLSDDQWDAIEAMYDAEVAYADAFVGELFDEVRERVDGETVFVVTGDHGDLFGERGLLGHNLVLHDGLVHVPLVTHGLPGVEDAADGPVQHVDVTRTLAEYVGCPAAQFQGRDLRSGTPSYAVSQRGHPHFDEYVEQNSAFDPSRFHRAPVTAVRSAEFKYLRSEDRRDLYRLPDETTDVRDAYATAETRLADHAEAVLAETGVPEATREDGRSATFDEDMRAQLSDLGYL